MEYKNSNNTNFWKEGYECASGEKTYSLLASETSNKFTEKLSKTLMKKGIKGDVYPLEWTSPTNQ